MKVHFSYCAEKNYYAIILENEKGKKQYLSFDRLKISNCAKLFGITLKDIREREYVYNLEKEVFEK